MALKGAQFILLQTLQRYCPETAHLISGCLKNQTNYRKITDTIFITDWLSVKWTWHTSSPGNEDLKFLVLTENNFESNC